MESSFNPHHVQERCRCGYDKKHDFPHHESSSNKKEHFHHHCACGKKHHFPHHHCGCNKKHHFPHHHCGCDKKHHFPHHHCGCDKKHHFPHHKCDGFFVTNSCCIPTCFPDKHGCCIELFHLRLAGLDGNLNFELFRKKGCCAEIKTECAGEIETTIGRVCNVGTDFIDVIKDDHTTVTILKERISQIVWSKACSEHSCYPPCEKKEEESKEEESNEEDNKE